MTISFDPSILLSYYQAKAGILTGQSGTDTGTSTTPAKVAPTPPWTTQPTATQTSAAVTNALLGRKLIDENAAKLDLPSASADYKKLFALYQGLDTLMGVATQAQAKGVTSTQLQRLQTTFANGLTEVANYAQTAELDQLRLTPAGVTSSAQTTAGVPVASTSYVTAPLVSGASDAIIPGLQGDAKFNITINRLRVDHVISIDLADLGSQPRTLGNVVNLINQQLQNAGLLTRVGTQRIAAVPQTVQVGGKTITLSAGQDQWALKVKTDSSETVSFSAPSTAGAVYVAQSVGDPNPDGDKTTNDSRAQSQLLKFQTDTTAVDAPPQTVGQANWVDGRTFAENLDPSVKTVRASAVGSDGSVYMLADITGKLGDQAIKGAQDVALLKYDSAGNLQYQRTLGAAGDASGLALAVSADGKVAIAGSLTGTLGGAIDGPVNSGATGTYAANTDSFVTVFDKDGQEQWTERRGTRQDDEAGAVAFGADGTVYVAGRSKSNMPGTTAIGGWDGYVEGFKADTTGKVQTLFTQSFGSTADDKPAGLVVDGSGLVVAGVENGHAVVRRFDVSGATPSLVATRDLGDLQGGGVAGIALDGGDVVVAGTTRSGALIGGTVTRAYAGGADGFASRLSSDLTASSSDSTAYYGGSGDDTVASLAAAGGKVWIAGSAGTDLPGQAPVGSKDGFLAELDVGTGAIDWSRRFTGKDGQAAPSAIAVDAQGSSVLDRLGLPTGTLDMSDSQQLSAVTSLRTGDQFTVKVGSGLAKTVTLDNSDTMDTLATKLQRALGFQGKVDLVTVNGKRTLKITPGNDRTLIQIGAGTADTNALALLGLPEGLVRTTTTKNGVTVPGDGKAQIYGLGLSSTLNLDDAAQVSHTLAVVSAAMGVIRTAYQDLVTAASPKSTQTAAAVTGPVPAYLTAQIANYQAGLDRLINGG